MFQDLSTLNPRAPSTQVTPTNKTVEFKEFSNLSGVKYIKKHILH